MVSVTTSLLHACSSPCVLLLSTFYFAFSAMAVLVTLVLVLIPRKSGSEFDGSPKVCVLCPLRYPSSRRWKRGKETSVLHMFVFNKRSDPLFVKSVSLPPTIFLFLLSSLLSLFGPFLTCPPHFPSHRRPSKKYKP